MKRVLSVARRRVTDTEYEKAEQVLVAFNEVASTRFSSGDALSKIIQRIREFPELTVEQHAAIIRAAFAVPWWKGPPSPSVVYGNEGLFERTMLAAETRLAELGDVAGFFDDYRRRRGIA